MPRSGALFAAGLSLLVAIPASAANISGTFAGTVAPGGPLGDFIFPTVDGANLFPGFRIGDPVTGRFWANATAAVASSFTPNDISYSVARMTMSLTVHTEDGDRTVAVPGTGGGLVAFDWAPGQYDFLLSVFDFSPTGLADFQVVINFQPTPFYKTGGPLLQSFAVSDANAGGGLGAGALIEFVNPDSQNTLETDMYFSVDRLNYTAPEPASIAVLGLGLLGLLGVHNRARAGLRT
jgi:hypothetical protein